MKKNNVLFYLSIILLSFSCTKTSRLNMYLEMINKYGIKVDSSGWNVIQYVKSYDNIIYKLDKKKQDTILNLSFKYDGLIDTFEYINYRKFFFDKGDNFYHTLELGIDTLYHYKQKSIENYEGKSFISGKYFYQYKFNLLNPEQMNFFENNKDSLIKIRGDSIPELPSKL